MSKTAAIGAILALLSTILYGLSPTITKLAFASGLTFGSLMFCRYAVAFAISVMVCRIKGISLKLRRSQIGCVTAVALACFFTNVLHTEAYRYLTGMVATTVACTYIVFILVIELIIGRVKKTRKKISALLLTVVGVGCIFISGDIAGTNLRAFELGIAGSICAALWFVILNNESVRDLSEETMMVYTLLPCVAYFGMEGLITGESVIASTPRQWIYVLILGVVILFISRLAFYKAVRYIGASNASMIDMLEPFFSGLFGVVTLHEMIPGGVLAGTVITVLAIFLSMDVDMKHKRKDEGSSEEKKE